MVDLPFEEDPEAAQALADVEDEEIEKSVRAESEVGDMESVRGDIEVELPQQERERQRDEWDRQLRYRVRFSDICPADGKTTKAEASRAFQHMLTRASQGKIVLEQEEAFGEILSTPVSRSSMEHTKITQSATLSSYTGIRTQSFSSDPAMSMG